MNRPRVWVPGAASDLRTALAQEKKRSQTLARELNRKEKALAETAVLLTLRKKAAASLWGGRGRMMSTPDRQAAVLLIQEAVRSGARKRCACAELELTLRTFERWTRDGGMASDTRPMAVRPIPAHALSAQERAEVLAVANSPRFADLPPTQIVPQLADEGRYLASESTFYRLLRAEKYLTHRGRAKAPQAPLCAPPLCHRTQSALCLGYHVLSTRYRLPPTIP